MYRWTCFAHADFSTKSVVQLLEVQCTLCTVHAATSKSSRVYTVSYPVGNAGHKNSRVEFVSRLLMLDRVGVQQHTPATGLLAADLQQQHNIRPASLNGTSHAGQCYQLAGFRPSPNHSLDQVQQVCLKVACSRQHAVCQPLQPTLTANMQVTPDHPASRSLMQVPENVISTQGLHHQ
jgi:hypothetical protein